MNGAYELGNGCVLEPESGDPVFYRVLESAGRSDDGRRSITLGDHLTESARLVARRHQEEVGARVQQTRQRIVETGDGGDAIGKPARDLREVCFERGVAIAKDAQADAPVEQLGHGSEHEIDSLLVSETAHDREHGPLRLEAGLCDGCRAKL